MLNKITQKLFILLMTLLMIVSYAFFGIPSSSAQANSLVIPMSENYDDYDWNEIDVKLVEGLENARQSTEEFANSELNYWVKKVMVNVDHDFLNWYYSYLNQKAMEFGIPFAWLAFKLDEPLKVFRKDEEKELNAADLIQKRMVEDFNRKFQSLVFTEEVETELKNSLERVGRNYSSAIGFTFTTIQKNYHIPDILWQEHLKALSQLTYDTGVFSTDNVNSNLLTNISTVTTLVIGTRLAANFAVKAGGKVATKAGASVAAKAGAQLLDPVLAVGFLVWDVWDYNRMVSHESPEMRQNILDYLNEMKYSILLAPENSVMAAIDEVQNKLEKELSSLSYS